MALGGACLKPYFDGLQRCRVSSNYWQLFVVFRTRGACGQTANLPSSPPFSDKTPLNRHSLFCRAPQNPQLPIEWKETRPCPSLASSPMLAVQLTFPFCCCPAKLRIHVDALPLPKLYRAGAFSDHHRFEGGSIDDGL